MADTDDEFPSWLVERVHSQLDGLETDTGHDLRFVAVAVLKALGFKRDEAIVWDPIRSWEDLVATGNMDASNALYAMQAGIFQQATPAVQAKMMQAVRDAGLVKESWKSEQLEVQP